MKNDFNFFKDKLEYVFDENEYILVDEYNGYKEKNTFKHKCGQNIVCTGEQLLKKEVVCNCLTKKTRKKTFESFKEEIESSTNGEYTVIEFNGSHNPAKFKHNVCGNIFELSRATSFTYSNCKCSCCSSRKVKRRVTLEDIENAINEVEDYELISVKNNMGGSRNEIVVKHTTCGKKFTTNYNRFYSVGQRCPSCSKKNKSGRKRIKEKFVKKE